MLLFQFPRPADLAQDYMNTHLIEILRLVVDFGLVVLVWIVQTIIYPSFLYMTEEQVRKWHPRYSTMITFFVAPLMFLQVGTVIYQIVNALSPWAIVSILCVLAVWCITFLQAVPLHRKIGRIPSSLDVRKQLVKVNWPRTLLWTLVFVLGVIEHIA